MTNKEQLILEARAQRLKCAKEIGAFVGGRFLLAGGALTKDDNPKDFDIYGVDASLDPDRIAGHIMLWEPEIGEEIPWVLSKPTRNAATASIKGQVVQFCKYFKTLPQKTIEAFDFAHCQAGAIFSKEGELLEVVSTPAFWEFEKTGSTWYTGSEYPLSSLMRCMKFHKRGLFKDNAHKPSALKILYDIVERGFVDEEDFDDQCASISESFVDFNGPEAEDLFDVLLKKEGN